MSPPTKEEITARHDCAPALRDSLLTRSILVFVSVENIRDANILLGNYISDIESRSSADLAKSYMNKTDGQAPSHVTFNSMLLKICEKNEKTAPLFTWLLKGFNSELVKCYKSEILKGYTTKIGRVYFNIEPPPSMMATLENMVTMMGGGGANPGMNPAMNPAMMQAMMQGGMRGM